MPQNDKRRRILQAAIKVFAAKGFFQARTKEIAREADVGEGTIFTHFRSKEALLVSIFEEVWSALIPRLRKRIAAIDDPDQCMDSILDASLRLFQEDRALARIVLVELKRAPDLYSPGPIRLLDDTLELLETVIRSGQEKGLYRRELDLRIVPMVLYGAVEGILTLWLMQDSHPGCHRYDLLEAKAVLMDAYTRMVRL